MSEAATRDDIDELLGIMKDMMQQFDARFTSSEAETAAVKVEVIETRAELNGRIDSLDKKYDHLITTLDSFLSRIDKYETELAARDSQFERLLTWARKVSEKTGIPLENL